MYTRFKDDIEIAMESLGKGCKMGTGKLVEDENKSESKGTMEVIHQIANEVTPMIKLYCRNTLQF